MIKHQEVYYQILDPIYDTKYVVKYQDVHYSLVKAVHSTE